MNLFYHHLGTLRKRHIGKFSAFDSKAIHVKILQPSNKLVSLAEIKKKNQVQFLILASFLVQPSQLFSEIRGRYYFKQAGTHGFVVDFVVLKYLV